MSRLVQTTHLPGASKRLFGIPGFRLYALADGIGAVRARAPRRPIPGAVIGQGSRRLHRL
ncbi:MAG: hypothetical protein QF511_00815 [Rhodospirillales bacterium]|jgi:hypothetical protein|nr:hypothetical protein [Rhodospirillales bacterium]MDP7215773.1 hypothetical protein [Rhodospirillales bacterium]HIJ44079.1 hypothetical protein [Rhodospirillaceae bacterium]HIJ93031.1 hypothetical protein [Rhodospirillaceae bacterium]HJO75650.1 hypothetical protein [Rhodospirillales bacterium]